EGALQAPVWTLPLEKMEEMAMIHQPDVREMSYQTRITADESRKALLKLFPGISLSTSRQRDDNSFTLNKDWYEAGLRVTWNLMNLLSGPSQMAFSKTSEEVVAAKRLALRMALLSQVHVAWRQFEQASIQLQRTDELYQVEKALARHMENRASQDAQSPLDRISSSTSAILAELRRYQSLAQAHNALGRMMATTGQDPAVTPIREGSLADLTTRVDNWLAGQLTQPQSRKEAAATPAKPVSPPVAAAATPTRPVTTPVEAKATPTQAKPEPAATVNAAAQTHTGPGKHYRKLHVLQPGENVTVYEQSKNQLWSRIGERQWISSTFIDINP
ncbi:MAG: TolC family protein, partial [Magnetococcales bacterium]|nr:TolC family protein [Magnetococcales bacterium]